jgi:tryptophan 7-halogenase
MDGMGVKPRSYPPLVDRIDFNGLTTEMDRAADILKAFVADLPTHQAFIDAHCPAPPVELPAARAVPA